MKSNDAHMDLVQPLPAFSLYNNDWPILTLGRSLPPAKLVTDGATRPEVDNTIVSNGAILSGCKATESVISPNVRVLRDAVLDGAIVFEDCVIGEGAVVRRAVLDKNVIVPAGVRIGVDRAEDEARFTVSDSGVVAVPKNYRFD